MKMMMRRKYFYMDIYSRTEALMATATMAARKARHTFIVFGGYRFQQLKTNHNFFGNAGVQSALRSATGHILFSMRVGSWDALTSYRY